MSRTTDHPAEQAPRETASSVANPRRTRVDADGRPAPTPKKAPAAAGTPRG